MRLSRLVLPRSVIQYTIVIVIGLILALWLSGYLLQQSRTQAELRLSQRAGQLAVAVQQSVNAKLQVLQAFQAFYAVGQIISLDEFKKFAVVTLAYHPDIQALQWIPVITADELAGLEARGKAEFGEAFGVFERDSDGNRIPVKPRDFYFPIYYIEPMQGNEAAHGLDAGFEPKRRAVLIEAWHTGKATVSAPIRLVQEVDNQYGILLYQPIYTQILPPETEAERIKSLIGLVPVVLRTGDFMHQSLRDFNTFGFNITLRDPLVSDVVLHSSVTIADDGFSSHDFRMVNYITLANRQWELEFVAPSAYIDVLVEFDGSLGRYIVAGLTVGILIYLAQRNRIEKSLRKYALTLEDTNQELDAYNHTIAHDLKSPLAVISGYAYLLGDETLSDDGRKMLDTIPKVADNMIEMIDELLQLAKLRDAQATVTSVNMNAVLENAIERFENQRQHITVEGSLPPALGHAPWLVEVFANLISNALKYTPDDRIPNIRIRGRMLGEFVRYEVQDNGVGIGAEDQQRVFEMFTRLANTDKQKGLGIGLSIVKRVMKRLDGQVGVDSRLGDGSTFWFILKNP